MTSRRTTWKEVLTERRNENFIGRAEHLSRFVNNFSTEIPAFLLFFVTGEGGVGKSSLLKQFETTTIGPSIGALTIICNEAHPSPVGSMGHIASKLAETGISYTDFDERYKTYRSRREEIESDPKAPRGAFNLVVRGMTDFAIKSARTVPGAGVFAEYVDEKAAGEALAQGLNYIIDRIGNKDEVELLREPERILTPLFISLLNKACEKHRLVLMFDVFERTREALEPWLLKFLEFEYGELETKLTFIISGRDTADQRWTQMASSICYITLEPFAEDETRLYLNNRGVTDERLVSQIHADTGGLPVLVELLAGTNPKPGAALPDISKDAVIRFLQWIPEEEKRNVALLAAVPRNFNLDILSTVLGSNATNYFSWLSTQSYIRTSTVRGSYYHEKVRELMLRYLRTITPTDLAAAHSRLETFFAAKQLQLGLDNRDAYRSKSWRDLELERTYHMLCARHTHTSEAVNTFLRALRWRSGFAGRVAQVLEQAAHEVGSEELQRITKALTVLYQSYAKGANEDLVVQTNLLARERDLDPVGQSAIYHLRSLAHWRLNKLPEALADLNRALELDETNAEALALRGQVYAQMGMLPGALDDLNRALDLDEKKTLPFLIIRSQIYALMNKFPEALANLNQALELDETNAGILIIRSQYYDQMDMLPEALADLNRALELDETNAGALIIRSRIYDQMDMLPEALADLNQALELDETNSGALAVRSEIYARMNKFPEALANLNRALELDETKVSTLISRGQVNTQMGKLPAALADFNQALALDKTNVWALALRGQLYGQMDKYSKALRDLDRAIELDEKKSLPFLIIRSQIYSQMGRYPEALADLNRAIELDETNAGILIIRGQLYGQMDMLPEALADLNRAIELDETNAGILIIRSQYYDQMDMLPEALADLNQALELDETNAGALVSRGQIYDRMDMLPEALADLNQALELDETNVKALVSRGQVYTQMGKLPAALADFNQALALDETNVKALVSRGQNYAQMDKFPEALADLNRAVKLSGKSAWALAKRSEIYAQMDEFPEALADLNRAVKLSGKSAWVLAKRGEIYAQMEKFPEALADLNRALELDEKNVPSLAIRGELYRHMGRYPEALADFNRAP